MSKEVRSKIHQLIDSIKDENTLQVVMDDVAYYAGNKEITDELNEEQLKELDDAISDACNNEIIDWDDFKRK